MEKYSGLDLLFETELRHLYKAENEIYEGLLTMANQALSPELYETFMAHRSETEHQIGRLSQIFTILDIDVRATKLQGLPGFMQKGKEMISTLMDLNFTDRSKGLDGLLSEGKALMRHFKNTDAADLALMNAAAKIENFEIACYKFLCCIAEKMGQKMIVELLKTSLEEEEHMENHLMESIVQEAVLI